MALSTSRQYCVKAVARVEARAVDQTVDEVDVAPNLVGVGLAGGRQPDGAADLGGQVAGRLAAQPVGEAGGLLVGERAVERPSACVGTVVV